MSLTVGRNSILNFPAKIWTGICRALLCGDDSSHSQGQSGKRLLLASRGHPIRSLTPQGTSIWPTYWPHMLDLAKMVWFFQNLRTIRLLKKDFCQEDSNDRLPVIRRTFDHGSRITARIWKAHILKTLNLLNDLVKASFFKAMWTNWWWSPFSMQVVNKKRGNCFPREVSNISGRLLYIPLFSIAEKKGFLHTQQLYRHDQSSTVAGLSQQCWQEQSRL